MTVIDFIDVIDDIIDLSSDEETVQQDHIATQPPATLVDWQDVFVLAGEGMQDVQAAFVSAGEGSQEATESAFFQQDHIATQPPVTLVDLQDVFPLAGEGRQDAHSAFVSASERSQEATESENALVATASPLVTEQPPLHTVESQNCLSSPTAPFSSLISTTPMVLSSEVCDTKQDVFVLAGEGRQDAKTAFVSVSEASQETTESVNALVATALPSVTERLPLGTAESKSCPSSATSAPLPCPASTTLKALASEDGDTKLMRVKHPKKNNHTSSTPRKSPRLRNNPVEELAASPKRSRMLEQAGE